MRLGTALLALLGCASYASAATQRLYYIAVDQVLWDFAPLGHDNCDNLPWNDDTGLYTSQGLGSKSLMAIYQQYTDASFQTLVKRNKDEEHLGILGPIIRAVGGDTVLVVFRNNHPYSNINLNPSGAIINDTKPAEPGETKVYQLNIPFEAAPAATEQASSKMWLYRSTVDVIGDANQGLLGAMIVTKPTMADSAGRPTDVDREIVMVLQVLNQNANPMLNATFQLLGQDDRYAGLSQEDFEESGMKHCINGHLYCNLPGLNVPYGKKTRWYVGVEGNEVDLHSAHWHGNTLLYEGHNFDQISLLAGGVKSGDMIPDAVGTWLFHCHVNDHIHAGMLALYSVDGGPDPSKHKVIAGGALRSYYIAVEEKVWDYAPLQQNACGRDGGNASLSDFTEEENEYMVNGTYNLGRQHLKAVFVEYTDASFTTVKERSEEDAYLGILGPTLRAEVGDYINITLHNKLPEYNISMHPHGVFYLKHSEGAPYNDGRSESDKQSVLVGPDQTLNYIWEVPVRAGPGPKDPSSVMWTYHSHVNEITDVNAGLLGAIIVTRKGEAKPDGTAKGVDKEFVLAYHIIDEVSSFYFAENIDLYKPNMNETDREVLEEDGDEAEYEHFHAINGMLFCNLPRMKAMQNSNVRFHTFSLGTEDGFHAPGIFASQFTSDGRRKESLNLIPGGMHSADAFLEVPGTYQVSCRTSDHYTNGMQSLLEVVPSEVGAVALTSSGRTREYFIKAVEEIWDYVPGGFVDKCTGENMTEGQLLFSDPAAASLGNRYHKALYRGYSDANFTTALEHSPELGVQGPLMKVQVGDTLRIVFRNGLDFPVNLQLSGGFVPTAESADSGAVEPNATVTYVYKVPAAVGPTQMDLSAVGYTYRSMVDFAGHTNAGLLGAILVSNQGASNTNRREIPLLFDIQNENLSVLLKKNMEFVGKADADPEDPDFEEGNKKHSINGYLYCHQPVITVAQNSLVRLVMIGIGGETDMHEPIFTNQLLRSNEGAAYTVQLYPGIVRVADMLASAPGLWVFNCNVQDHIDAGMKAILGVTPRLKPLDMNELPSYRRMAI